ncbi:carboxypeptidase O-like [Rhinatrema bivittatum]|uniref:carboxypeptidase O-like n=1 Tax=Rhinatrema bivittatum TaxID=194408 RepID=UPI0011291289|nr:carboxypeptidase O-like [Rhinatrema bivittatum]
MLLLLWKTCILGILASKILCQKVKYDGDQVLQVTPQTSEHVHQFQQLSDAWMLDLWMPHLSEDIHVGANIHVRVPASLVQQMKEKLLQYSIPFQVLIKDVQELLVKPAMKSHSRHSRSLASYNYTKYHPMEEIKQWMMQIEQEYNHLVTRHQLGETYELQPIYYLKLGQPSDKPKKIIWMDCGIHAREWIAPAYCQWFVKEILQNYNNDQNIKEILKNIDFYIVPVLNIDGYIYSWTTDRLWRKSRAKYNNGTCFGTDLNRNFDAMWCSIGASKNCSALTFCGTEPESEPETKAVVNLVKSRKSDILCFLTIHSYGQLILQPYGYTRNPSKNHMEMLKVAKMAAEAIEAKHGTIYTVGSASHILYSNSGSSRDWAADLGLDFSYTFELRDNGTYGFQLPEDQIQPTCEETMAGMMTIIDYINKKNFKNNAVTITSATLWLNILLLATCSTTYTLWI